MYININNSTYIYTHAHTHTRKHLQLFVCVCIYIYKGGVLGFSRIYVQHSRWDFHEDAGENREKRHIFQTSPRTTGIDEGPFGNPKP